MKVKTSDLTGIALDYAVALCECPDLVWEETIGLHHASPQIVIPERKNPDCYFSPTSKWQQGGPIIEREGVTIKKTWENGTLVEGIDAWYADIAFINQVKTLGEFRYYGPTPLIAAMRCYVASKLGEEIEIPEELENN